MLPEPRVLVLGCGALARELLDIASRFRGLEVACLPAKLHNTPQFIPEAVRQRLQRDSHRYSRVFVAYGDCGTAGELDRVLDEFGADRLPGPHCYSFFAGQSAFDAIQEEDPATFYLTDYLARNFDRLILKGLGIDRHPELKELYFGNYRRVVYLSQYLDADLIEKARRAAASLGLGFEHRHVGLGEAGSALEDLSRQMGLTEVTA